MTFIEQGNLDQINDIVISYNKFIQFFFDTGRDVGNFVNLNLQFSAFFFGKIHKNFISDFSGSPVLLSRILWDIYQKRSIGRDGPGENRKGTVTRSSIRAPFGNWGLFRTIQFRHITFMIEKSAEFRENRCKFNFISSLRARIRKIYVERSKVRNLAQLDGRSRL